MHEIGRSECVNRGWASNSKSGAVVTGALVIATSVSICALDFYTLTSWGFVQRSVVLGHPVAAIRAAGRL